MIHPNKERDLQAFKEIAGPNKEIDSKMIDDFVKRINMPNAKMSILSTLLGLKYAKVVRQIIKNFNSHSSSLGKSDAVIPFRYAKIFVSSIKGC